MGCSADAVGDEMVHQVLFRGCVRAGRVRLRRSGATREQVLSSGAVGGPRDLPQGGDRKNEDGLSRKQPRPPPSQSRCSQGNCLERSSNAMRRAFESGVASAVFCLGASVGGRARGVAPAADDRNRWVLHVAVVLIRTFAPIEAVPARLGTSLQPAECAREAQTDPRALRALLFFRDAARHGHGSISTE